jgi:hypothetical protein
MGMPYVEAIAIAARLAKLEDENRRLKCLVAATALLSFLSATLLVGTLIRPGLAQEDRPRLEMVRAYDYFLQDSAGRVRARLSFSDASGSPMLTFNDADGKPRLIISAEGQSTSILAYSPNGARFQTMSTAGLDGAIVEASGVQRGAPEGKASLFAFNQATQMRVEDAKGFRTIVGNASIEGITGREPERTSAASVVMYKKGGHVVWQAPPERVRR